jgi:hypothetical protein
LESKLSTLIAYYEEEKNTLLQLIDKCVKEEEYELAHFHQTALYLLNQKLQTLKNIEGKFYDEKSFKQKTIDLLEKELQSTNVEYLKENLTSVLLQRKEELEKLNQSSNKTDASGSVNIFDETLMSLFDKKIKSFKLILKKAANLFFEFTYYGKTLKITLPFIKQHIKKSTFHYDHLESFEKLGFKLTGENKLVLTVTGNKEEIEKKLKIILSKIVFELFYFKEFQNESYIEIKAKTKH